MNAPGGPQQQVVITTVDGGGGPGFLIRAIWFLLVGWWLGGVTIALGYLCCLTIIGLPLAFMLFNAIPVAMTLRPRSGWSVTQTSAGGVVYAAGSAAQLPLLVRAIWFIFVGWWLGAVWMGIAYLLCLLIVTLPFGLLMFNRVGAVMTLLRY